jgi:hypothetical protein
MRLLDAGRDFGPGRVPTIYIENHDHARIMRKAGTRPFWYLTQPYAIALFTSPGATLIYNGQEFGMDNDMPKDGPDRVRARPLDTLVATGHPARAAAGRPVPPADRYTPGASRPAIVELLPEWLG